jgi:hypothetical protein
VISDDEARQEQVAGGAPPAIVDAHLSIFRAIREGRLAGITPTVERVTGHKPVAFDEWTRENLAAFQ